MQHVGDLTAIAHRIAELSLNPGAVAQDGFLTSHVIESMRLPEDATLDLSKWREGYDASNDLLDEHMKKYDLEEQDWRKGYWDR